MINNRACFSNLSFNIIVTLFIVQFLSLKGPDEGDEKVDSLEHMEKFWQYLASRGISSHRSAIVKAIAEKMNSFLPGIYDPEQYESDEDED